MSENNSLNFGVTTQPSRLTCCSFNARSLNDKLNDLHTLMMEPIDLICITETWLRSDIPDSLIIDGLNYSIFRCDRVGKIGGGVCILTYNDKIAASRVKIADKYSDCEIVAVDIINSDVRFRVINCYRPPSSDTDSFAVANFQLLIDSLSVLCDIDGTVLLCGDFNLPSINWDNDPPLPTGTVGCSDCFISFINQHLLHQFVTDVTRPSHSERGRGSILDLVLCNDNFLLHEVTVEQPFCSSDHFMVKFNVLHFNNTNLSQDVRFRYDFARADWDSIISYLYTVDFSSLLSTELEPADSFERFYSVLSYSIELFVPKVDHSRAHKTNRKYYPAYIRKLILKKRQAWRLYRKFRTASCLQKYKGLATACRNAIYEYTKICEEKTLETANLGQFYRLANSKFSTKSAVGPIKGPDGRLTVDSALKASVFQKYFSSVFTSDDNRFPSFGLDRPPSSKLSQIAFNPFAVRRILQKINVKSTCGPDGVPAVFLNKCRDVLCYPLSMLYQLSFNSSFIPEVWRKAYITPVYKKGDSSEPKNYRPIALTCNLCKVMEAVVKDSMMTFFLQNNLITKQQHAFLAKHSTTSNLLECTNDWVMSLKHRIAVDTIYIDFSRAFDSVVHSKLLTKLSAYGIDGLSLQWIASFLSGRLQCVVTGNCSSDWAKVLSGVPQGSVIGPLLFIVFINDVESVCHGQCKLKLYADDLKLYSAVTSDDDSVSLQQSVDNLSQWAALWQLSINVSKSCVLHLGAASYKSGHVYYIDGNALNVNNSVCDLGVNIQENLCFHNHVASIVSKANTRVGIIYRGFRTRDPEFLRKAFITYVRPVLEYCSNVWNPHHVKYIDLIENVQRHFTKRVPQLRKYSYLERLAFLDLESLELRRLKSDLVMYFKIFNNLVALDAEEYFNIRMTHDATRSKKAVLVKSIDGNANCFYSFFNRSIDCWNALPPDVVNSRTLSIFKLKLNLTNLNHFLSGNIYKN